MLGSDEFTVSELNNVCVCVDRYEGGRGAVGGQERAASGWLLAGWAASGWLLAIPHCMATIITQGTLPCRGIWTCQLHPCVH